jgi:hypothetical protein
MPDMRKRNTKRSNALRGVRQAALYSMPALRAEDFCSGKMRMLRILAYDPVQSEKLRGRAVL